MKPTIAWPAPLNAAPLVSNWLKFQPRGSVRIRTGRVELGQGNMTALMQIAADELDVAPEQITLVSGDTRETPDEGFTSGSQSIAVGGMALRLAASAARNLMLAEAAKLLQARPEALSVSQGVIFNDGQETDLSYWSLAETVAFDVAIGAHAEPKPPAERRLAGQSFARIDLAERIDGTPFVHDLVLPGMLHGRPVHPPSYRAVVAAVDEAELRARRGIEAVVRDGSFLGVVAGREEDAIAAADWARNHATWDAETGAPADPVAAIRDSDEEAEIVHTVGAPGATVGHTIETVVTRPYISHAPIGPSCAVAQWVNDKLTIWSHTQGVFPLRQALADVFAIAVARIDVIHMNGAGCYGHNGADDVALDAALLAKAVPGRPVRVVWSRADEFGCAPLGPAMATRASATIDVDNRITAMRVTTNSAPHGNRPGRNGAPNLRAAAYLSTPFPIPRSADVPSDRGGGADRNAVPLYAIPNVEVVKRIVHEPPFRTSSLRGLGAFLNVYAIETLMDDIAHETARDAVELRLEHLEDERARHTIQEVARASSWPGPTTAGAGYGLGFARYKNTAAYCAVVARVEVDREVRLTHAWAHVDAGEIINPDGLINQIEGGIIQSASWTLKEAVGFDGVAVATCDWDSYPILRFSEVPEIAVGLTPRPELPPLGCAEAAQGPMAAAIGNAVRNVLGIRVRDLPLTRDRITSVLTVAN